MNYQKKTKPALYLSLPGYQTKARANQAKKTPHKSNGAQRKPIRKRSKSMAAKMVVYRIRRAEFLKANPVCAVFPWHLGAHTLRKATEVHHLRGRAGKLLLDERYWLAVSKEGHQAIHDRPEWARSKGYLCSKGHWGKQD